MTATYDTPDARDTAWMADALCAQVDTELFFPEKGGNPAVPKSVCRGCPVITECLEYALRDGSLLGIWGGTSYRDRQLERRRRGIRLLERRHGTRNCYAQGCRLPECVQAKRDYDRAWNEQRRTA